MIKWFQFKMINYKSSNASFAFLGFLTLITCFHIPNTLKEANLATKMVNCSKHFWVIFCLIGIRARQTKAGREMTTKMHIFSIICMCSFYIAICTYVAVFIAKKYRMTINHDLARWAGKKWLLGNTWTWRWY